MKQLIFIFLTLFCLQSFAQDSLFIKANKEYRAENYTSAITIYDSIISNGFESSELFYNLGNCYYKKEDWANTIWHYEKSLKLNPNNKDAAYNLGIAKLKIIDQIEEIPQLFYKKWQKNLVDLLSIKVWQTLTIISIWVSLIIYLINRLRNYRKKYLLITFNIITLILIYTTYSSYQQNNITNEAIIYSLSVVVNSAPTDNSNKLFTLHSGTKVEIIDRIDEWINIKITNGNSGWIKESDCKTLY